MALNARDKYFKDARRVLGAFLKRNEGIFEDFVPGKNPHIDGDSFSAILLEPFLGYDKGMYVYGRVTVDFKRIELIFSDVFSDVEDNFFYDDDFLSFVYKETVDCR